MKIEHLENNKIRCGCRIFDMNNESDQEQFWWHVNYHTYGMGIGRWPVEIQIQARLLQYPELKRELENDEYDWFDADPKRLLAHIDWWISCKLEAEDYDGPHLKLND